MQQGFGRAQTLRHVGDTGIPSDNDIQYARTPPEARSLHITLT